MEGDRRFEYTLVPGWPRLAWVAQIDGSEHASVLHGRCVETNPEWFVEGAWAGEFERGDFDRCDVAVCTGLRLRRDAIHCVAPSDALIRLYLYSENGTVLVSNTLPGLLAVARLDLRDDFDYGRALRSLIDGLRMYQREIPTDRGSIEIAHFHGRRIRDGKISSLDRAKSMPEFESYGVYRDYLSVMAQQIVSNARSERRRFPARVYTTLSAGYDSPAVSVLAAEAGVDEGFTVTHAPRYSRNLFDTDDSGLDIARNLGIDCRAYPRTGHRFPSEDATWAAMGEVGDLHLSIFDYAGDVSLLFTGFYGDVIWEDGSDPHELMRRPNTSGARFSEARLEHGVFLCAPAFWSGEREREVLALASSDEMRPWRIREHYDRPVPRRILEEAGIPRGSFARHKKGAYYPGAQARPRSQLLRVDFAEYLRGRGKRPGRRWNEALAYLLEGLDYHLFDKLPPGLRFASAPWAGLPSATDFYLWANRRVRGRYLQALEKRAAGTGR